jgi:aspartyl-tRNA(Asn)/glutamyl-tRNA(Gln) amidotransferase subunit A
VPDPWSIARLSAAELVERYANRSLSPLEVLDAALAVIDDAEPELNALSVRTEDSARREAEASDQRWRQGAPLGPIDGVPATVKENLARAGIPMSVGNAGVEPVVPDSHSPVVDRLTEAGAVILGSTVMPDWGMLSSGVSSRHGITRSPWNPAWTTGGSSSGAGAAAAAGYAPLNVGSDIGGSIRLPGTWLGLTTLKPSAGRVPLATPYLGRVAGPLTRTVADAASLMSVIARWDARDWTALPPTELSWLSVAADPLEVHGLRIGLQLDAGCGMPVDPRVSAAVAAAATTFEEAGAVVEPVPPFLTDDLLHELDMFWRVRSWNDFQALAPEAQNRVLPFIRRWVEAASVATGSQVFTYYHAILEIQRLTVAVTEGYDIVLSPVAPVVAFPAEWPMPFGDTDEGMAHIAFTAPYNMSGQPSASVNCGFTQDGRPIGLQVSGRRFDDVGVLRAAGWYEVMRPAEAIPRWPIQRRGGGRAVEITPIAASAPEEAAARSTTAS